MKNCVLILILIFSGLKSYEQNPYYAPENDYKWGYKDDSGKVIIKAKYVHVSQFNEGYATVRTDYSSWQIIDKTGTTILELGSDYYSISDYSDGLIAFSLKRDGNIYGYLNLKGEIVIPPIFARAGNFKNGIAPVELYRTANSKAIWKLEDIGSKTPLLSAGLALIDKKGKEYRYLGAGLRPYTWRHMGDDPFVVSEGLIAAGQEGSNYYGFVDTLGNWKIKPQFYAVGPFSEGKAFAAFLENNYGNVSGKNLSVYIDKSGESVITLPERYEKLYGGCFMLGAPFKNGKAYMGISENDGDCGESIEIYISSDGIIKEIKR